MMYGNLTLASLKKKISDSVIGQIDADFSEVTEKVDTALNATSSLATQITELDKTTRKHNKPTFSLTFDDGWESQFTKIRPILGERGIRGTFFIIGNPQLMTGAPYLTTAQIKQIADEGHEIGDHTKTHPSKPTGARMREEWLFSKPWLESITGKKILTHCYPYGDFNDDVNRLAEGFFEATRGLDAGGKGMYNSKAYPIDGYDISVIKRLIDKVIEENSGGFCTLVIHEIYEDDDTSKPANRQTISKFTEWVDYLVSKRDAGLINIVPYYQGMRMYQQGLADIR